MAEECGIESDKDVISINAWICGSKVLRIVENPFEPTRLPDNARLSIAILA